MSNPWLTNNPFMSMWLSGANRMAVAMRSPATTPTSRQIGASMGASFAKATDDDLKALIREIAPGSPKLHEVIDFRRALAIRRVASPGGRVSPLPVGIGLPTATRAPVVLFPSAAFRSHA